MEIKYVDEIPKSNFAIRKMSEETTKAIATLKRMQPGEIIAMDRPAETRKRKEARASSLAGTLKRMAQKIDGDFTIATRSAIVYVQRKN